MSDSRAVTIPAADQAATADHATAGTRPARLLRALAQNYEPLSTPALASLLAEPGQRRRVLISCASALRRHEQAGHEERAGRAPKKMRPARHHPAYHRRRPPLARRPRQGASPPLARFGVVCFDEISA
jgi:hypothetical protein